jgi:hypothetical protein
MTGLVIAQITVTSHGAQHAPGGADPIPGLDGMKAGTLPPGMFGGQPLTAQVVFGTPYPDTSYSITLSVMSDGTKTFAVSVSNKTAAGFTVNLNTRNAANLVEVGWHTLPLGS